MPDEQMDSQQTQCIHSAEQLHGRVYIESYVENLDISWLLRRCKMHSSNGLETGLFLAVGM